MIVNVIDVLARRHGICEFNGKVDVGGQVLSFVVPPVNLGGLGVDRFGVGGILDELTEKYPDQFGWQPVVSSKMGRLSSSKENVGMIFQADGICSTADTHYHLIGNGQLVNEWKAGLAQAGVPDEKVTVEAYFNHRAESNNDAIDNIASVVSASSMSTVSS